MPSVWRTSIMAFYVLFTVFCWSSFILFRQINWANTPHLLRNIYIAVVLGFMVGKVFILLLMLVDDIHRLITWLIGTMIFRNNTGAEGGTGISRSVFIKQAALVVGGLSLLGFTYGIRNRYNYQVRKVKLKSPMVPDAFKGIKIVQISDIHTGSFDSHDAIARGIQKIMDLKADLILFTGDLVNNHSIEVDEKYQEIFSRLKAPMGVFSTLGNHDYGDYVEWPSAQAKVDNLDNLKRIHASMGWRLLMNEHVVLERGNDKIALVGIENWSAKANFPKYGDMTRAYAGLRDKNIPFKILMSHDPSHWQAQVTCTSILM